MEICLDQETIGNHPGEGISRFRHFPVKFGPYIISFLSYLFTFILVSDSSDFIPQCHMGIKNGPMIPPKTG